MIDHGPLTEPEAAPVVRAETAAPAGPRALQALEERLRRLEDAVAALQETRRPEEPRTDGAAAVSECQPTPVQALAEGTAVVADAGRRLLPLALNLLRPPDAEAVPPASHPQTWLGWEAYEDLRCICRMFVDRRYRPRLSAWLVPAFIVVAMLFSWMFVGAVWVVGPLLDKAVDLVLAFLGYKVLVREAQRYRAAIAHRPVPARP